MDSMTSVDDLVAALSASAHIGQEALDLQALHAQLSQTLRFPGTLPTPSGAGSSRPRTCTTPTAAPWAHAAPAPDARARALTADAHVAPAEDWEDELAVEWMLAAGAPASPFKAAPAFGSANSFGSTNSYASTDSFGSTNSFGADASGMAVDAPAHEHLYSSAFQNTHAAAPAPSFFAQAARPSASSPFYAAAASPFAAFGGWAAAPAS